MNDLTANLLILLAGFLSSAIDTLAGSGSAVSLPILVFLGMPANIANATNRMGLLAGSVAAILTFQRAKALDWPVGIILCAPVILGTAVGAEIASLLNAKEIGWVIFAAIAVTFIVLVSNPKQLLKEHSAEKPSVNRWKLLVFFAIGVEAGFITIDSSAYLLFALVLLVGYNLVKANAVKSLLHFCVSLTSLLVFAGNHEVDWHRGLYLALGSVAGAWVGGLLAMRPWVKVWIFRLLLVIIAVELIKLSHEHGLI